MGVCGSRNHVIVPVTTNFAADSRNAELEPKEKSREIKKSLKKEEAKPLEYKKDPTLTDVEREDRRRKLAEVAEQRMKQELTKGMTKEGSVEYAYMLKHKKDLEKFQKLDDGKQLDWNGT